MSETNNGIETLLSQLAQPRAEPLMQIASEILSKMMQNDEPAVKRQISKLSKTLSRLKRERDLLVERNRSIAISLGACECWGADEHCMRCGGLGLPGYFLPEKEGFVELVLPLLQSRTGMISSYLNGLGKQDDEANKLN